jgi:hypothetical protein
MLIVVPLLDILSSWPPRPELTEWRFEQFGLLVRVLPPATLGLALSLYIARALEHRRLLCLLAGMGVFTALLVTLLLGNFGLDAAELSARVQPAEKGRYAVTVMRLFLQSGLVAVALFALGVAGLRAYRRDRQTERTGTSSSESAALLAPKRVGIAARE